LSDWFNTEKHPDFFTTVVFERPGSAGMNWYLSELDRRTILNGFQDNEYPNAENLKLLRQWWAH
jgi:hypothetical protein